MLRLLIAIAVIFVMLAGWVAVQEFVRRKSPPMPQGCEEELRAQGCHHCRMRDDCPSREYD